MNGTDIDIAIIGGGVIGCAVAWELSKKYERIFLFEKNPGITKGENQSSRNSGVIHSGIYYDCQTRPEKAALCVEGNRFLYDFCERYQVPALNTGKLIVATTPQEDDTLELYLARARENNVPGVRKITGQAVAKREPNVVAVSALDIPSAGIIDAPTLVYRLHTLAEQNGAYFMTETEVTDVKEDGGHNVVTYRYRDGRTEAVRATVVVNAAGVEADRIARMMNPKSVYERDPIKGESYKYYSDKRPELKIFGTNVYPTPEVVVTKHGRHFTVGVHLTPTFEDLSYPPRIGTTVTVGPKVVAAENNQGQETERIGAEFMADRVRRFFPALQASDLIWHQAGIQARLKGHPDFIIAPDSIAPNVVHLLGIDSPGLTASLAIGRRAAQWVENIM
jgi:L-2-hydroxyglutarate oxidase LhgO